MGLETHIDLKFMKTKRLICLTSLSNMESVLVEGCFSFVFVLIETFRNFIFCPPRIISYFKSFVDMALLVR